MSLIFALIHTFSAHGAEVRTVGTILILKATALALHFFTSVLIFILNIRFAADKIPIGKPNKVSIKQDNFQLFRYLFGLSA